MSISITVQLNGKPVSAQVQASTSLVDFLRDQQRLTGTHVGCDTAQCGACTVLVDGKAVKSCNMLAVQADGHAITTIEGLANADGSLHPMQAAFRDCHGLQCGFCTPGMVMSALDNGQYTDDIVHQGQTYAVFVRSPHAHAKLLKVDTEAARSAPGVVGVFTGEDFVNVGGLPCGWLITSVDGTPMKEPKHPLLAHGKVRHVGDQVAVVIAETLAQAKAAASLVHADYEALPAYVDPGAEPGSVPVHDEAPDNLCYTWALGDKAAIDATFASAAHVTRLEYRNNRLIPNAIEPRAANAIYNRSDDSYTLHVANQNPHVERLLMAAFVLGIPEHKLRVVAPDVGGGFGSKIFLYAEETVLVWASKQVNRPIKWTAERSESFLTDAHGRDHVTVAEMAADEQGKFLAMRVHTRANLGAYLSTFA
ncbi:MAG: hypothetical protein EBV84_13815, partial [Betaproteobacteria bacterium]|nr:hypothetical protein [Betaproteobacteria bacterium]